MPRTLRTIHKAINEACDEIIEAADLAGTGTEVALNLLVNATLSYLEHSAVDLHEVARHDFKGEDLDTLVGWIKNGPEPSSAERVTSTDPGPLSIASNDAATAVPTSPPLPPVIGRYQSKHYPKCEVWIGLDCTCAQIAPKKDKGGGSRG